MDPIVTCTSKVLSNALERIANLENEVNDLREQNIELRAQIRGVRGIIHELERHFNCAIHDLGKEIGLDYD